MRLLLGVAQSHTFFKSNVYVSRGFLQWMVRYVVTFKTNKQVAM